MVQFHVLTTKKKYFMYSMCDWSNIWHILFNILKCKVIYYGRGSPEYTYYMNSTELEAVTEENDLGVLFQKDLKFSSHISQKMNKAKYACYYKKNDF